MSSETQLSKPNSKESPARLWARALREFSNLLMVDNDPARMNSIADLVFIAQFEIDLFNEGESTLTTAEIAPHRKFCKKWAWAIPELTVHPQPVVSFRHTL